MDFISGSTYLKVKDISFHGISFNHEIDSKEGRDFIISQFESEIKKIGHKIVEKQHAIDAHNKNIEYLKERIKKLKRINQKEEK